MTSEKVQPQAEVTEMEPQEGRTDHEPCWKKRTPEAGFLVNMKDHLDEFVNTSMDQHKICLKKTIRGVSNRLKKTGSIFRSADTESHSGVEDIDDSKEVQTNGTQ